MVAQHDHGNQLGDFVSTLNLAAQQQKEFQPTAITRFVTMDSKVDTIDSKVDMVDSKVDTVDSKVDTVDGKVDDVARNLVEVQKGQEEARQQMAKKNSTNRQFLAPLAALFNTKTGFVVWQPVQYTKKIKKTYRLVILGMPTLVWYHIKGCPDAQISELKTRSYYGTDEGIPLHPYEDIVAILEMTVFKPRAVGVCGTENESWNRGNFLVAAFEVWKKLEQQNERDYDNRPRTLPLMPGKVRNGHDGNDVVYIQAGPDDLSTGFSQPFGRSFTMEEKGQTPAMGQTWTAEVLDESAIQNFFGIPDHLRGKCHIVGGKRVSETDQTHAEGYGDKKKNIVAAMNRRLARASFRNKRKR